MSDVSESGQCSDRDNFLIIKLYQIWRRMQWNANIFQNILNLGFWDKTIGFI